MDKAANPRSDPVVKKISSNEFDSIFTENLKQLIRLFDKYKYELRIAGGAVRWEIFSFLTERESEREHMVNNNIIVAEIYYWKTCQLT